MCVLKMKPGAKAQRDGEPVHHDSMDSSPHMREMSPQSGGPLGSFYLAGPVLSLKGLIQPKLNIGQPNDIYEQEADRVADQVMSMPEAKGSLVNGQWSLGKKESSLVQRKAGCPECEEEKEQIQTKPLAEQITPVIQRQSEIPNEDEEEEKSISRKTSGSCGGSTDISSCVDSHISALKGKGQPLSPSTRDYFEPRFGSDFSNVRVHAGSDAAAIATEINAKAFTTGSDIFFGTGHYSPGTSGGKSLLAHELTHVIQQTSRGAVEIARVPDENGVRSGRYTFSTNCGWIDWGHAIPDLMRELIRRVQQASNALSTAGGATTATTGQLDTPTMSSGVRSGGLGIILSSASVRVRLLRPLSASEVNEVALSIFKTLSIAFETQQIWTDFLGQSSFAQEDLPSNLISFYMAVRGFNRQDVINFCGGLDATGSMAEFQRLHNFSRNFSFTPVGATGPWPAEFSTINDSAATTLYETLQISTAQGASKFNFCPLYRVVGTIGETDFLLFSIGGVTFSAADDLRVKPTFLTHPMTSGSYGDTTNIEVRPARPSDTDKFNRAGLSWPLEIPEPVLECLTSRGTTP